jgi:hypothetical protein
VSLDSVRKQTHDDKSVSVSVARTGVLVSAEGRRSEPSGRRV